MSAAAVSLRQAGAADEAALRALWCEAWQAAYPAFDYQARWPGMWDHWRALSAEIFLAIREKDDGEVAAGMLVLAPQDDGALLLEQIALPPREQGSGIAHLMMLFAKQKTRSALRLTVNAFNTKAIRFYEREAFRRCGSGVNAASGLPTFDYEWQR